MELVHIMVDIETLGLPPMPRMLSIGACRFNPYRPQPVSYLEDHSFYVAISGYTDDEPFITDQNTVQWWSEQSKEAQDMAFPSESETLKPKEAMQQFFSWCASFLAEEGDSLMVWARGTDFDITILEAHARYYGLSIPWPYNHKCDQRSVEGVLKQFYYDVCQEAQRRLLPRVPFSGIPHHPTDDAIHQARSLQSLYDTIASYTGRAFAGCQA